MRRNAWTALVALLALVLVASCGRDEQRGADATAGGDPGPTTVTSEGSRPDGDGEAGGSATSPPGAAARPRAGSPATTARSVPPAGEAPTTTAAVPTPGPGRSVPAPAVDDGSLGPPGAFARTLLRPRPAVTIVVERFHQRGKEPSSAALSYARSTLGQVAAKPVELRDPVLLDGSGSDWSADELRALADRQHRVEQGDGRAVLRLLFVGGTFEGSDAVLGVAVRGDVLAVFSDSVEAARTPVLSGAAIEEAVLVHELGHLLGLVDLARDTGRADPAHPGHSANSRSVMYWAVESDLIGQVLTGPPPREFDAADLADLQALREGA